MQLQSSDDRVVQTVQLHVNYVQLLDDARSDNDE
jgi:hypothetical protein